MTIYARHGSRLFFYDSAGLWIDDIDQLRHRISPDNLQSLMPDGGSNTISLLHVKNTDLGPLALRSRTLGARSLELAGVFMGEHLNVVTRATGRINTRRRAVGFARGRVREGEGPIVTAAEYSAWCAELDAELTREADGAALLARFASSVSPPANTDPINILIDMAELQDGFTNKRTKSDAKFDLEGLCVDVTPDITEDALASFSFDLPIDDRPVKIWIEWDKRRRKYWIQSPALGAIKAKGNDKVTLAKRFNQRQPFRIITSEMTCAYVHGAFYDLNLKLNDPNGPARLILDLLTPVRELKPVTSEKGQGDGRLETWPKGSLFGLLDAHIIKNRGNSLFGEQFSAVVCDDLGTETGDFIAVEGAGAEPGSIAFIVAKHKKGDEPGVSASAFYDVCAQGVKNLGFLKSDGREVPGSAEKWNEDWTLTTGKDPNKKTACIARRRAGPDANGFREMTARVRSAPGTRRAVWLVCAGGMLSKSALRQEFEKVKPSPHVLQFYHLVLSAFSSCQSVGVSLKIFCAD